jgi:hypothetical protein
MPPSLIMVQFDGTKKDIKSFFEASIFNNGKRGCQYNCVGMEAFGLWGLKHYVCFSKRDTESV